MCIRDSFGSVTEGMETVDDIAMVATDDDDVPESTVTLEKVSRVTP